MESPLRMSRHPERPVAPQSWEPDAIYTKSLSGCMTAAYVSCIINKHIENSHKGCKAANNAEYLELVSGFI